MTPDLTLLDRLDAAVNGAPGADQDLVALVADVRADKPTMAPEFAARLDELVATDFGGVPPEEAGPAERLRARFRRMHRPSLRPLTLAPVGALAAAAIAIVVLSSGGSSGTTNRLAEGSQVKFRPSTLTQVAPTVSSSAATGSAGSGVAKSAAPQADNLATPTPAPEASSAAPSSSASSAAGVSTTTPPAAAGHKVQRSTTLTLSTTTDKVQGVADQVVSITERNGGFVANSNVDVEGSTGAAQFTLRVPAEHSSTVLAAITKLGHVASMNQQTLDITGSFVSTGSRLTQLQRQLANLRAQQKTPGIQERISEVRAEITSQQQALQALRHQADDVTITLTVTGHKAHKGAVVPVKKHGRWSPHHAAHVALRVLEVAAGVALVALAILAVVAPLLILGLLGARTTRRRSREAALDAS